MNLNDHIRDVPDFPKPGILFKDITTLLAHPQAFAHVIDQLTQHYGSQGITKVIGIESRGFLFAAPLALALGAGMVPVRKTGKLPYKCVREDYALEYGTDSVEIHEDALSPSDKVLIVDDVIATGGTLAAACNLVDKLGAQLVECVCIIELTFLTGRERLGAGRPLHTLLQF